MKKVFLVVVCISSSFLYSMENQTPKMPPSRAQSVPSVGSFPRIIVTQPLTKSRPRFDSDPDQRKIITAVKTNEVCLASSSEGKK